MSNTRALVNQVLTERFGHQRFRPHQEDVCEAVTDGRDALVVMPTGSGKSLCYQLPGVARGGMTLVISPLIALIEDQVAKLRADGFRAARIHSGRDRLDSRQVCRDYLADKLDFLFIAPERLSVPGFPEFLAKRVPALIAVDEAHCISHWGHDFRPAYRTLGEHLPALRPAPILALTATATVRVQKDIVQRLGMTRPEMFIRGFWRDNLAVEARDCARKDRDDIVHELLAEPDSRPAIVYVPTRKESEHLAEVLSDIGAVPYHAGMEPPARARSQEDFMAGRAPVVVATVAFGMGVDKADIRTVIHTSLTGSIESYYQEIGRAGRDGEQARVVLLYSWSDRKLLEFLHARSYPPTSELADLYARIPEDFVPRESVMATSEEADESETAAFRQLVNHGALLWSPDDRVARVPRRRWRKDYEAQRDHRLHQIEDMVGFAQSGGCRMHGLVRYFSPAEAGTERCGLCDHCAPEATVSRQFREPTDEERAHLERALAALGQQYGMTPKRLHDEVFNGREIDRDRLERYVDALTRAGLVRQETDSFEKGGRVIMFQRLFTTGEGSVPCALDDAVLWLDLPEPRAKAKRGSAEKKSAPRRRRKKGPDFDQEPAAAECYEALRTWRAALAEENGMPAYHIASNAVLEAISVHQPDTERGLRDIKGMGPVKVEAYGEAILSILQELRLAE